MCIVNSRNSIHRASRRQIRRAFTLIEIIVVVTIIALLATMVAPRLWTNIAKTKQRIAQAEVKEIAKQVRLYCMDRGLSRPPGDFSLDWLLDPNDQYLSKTEDLMDPWDRPYFFESPGQRNPDFDIFSFGADGMAGGEGEDADVYN